MNYIAINEIFKIKKKLEKYLKINQISKHNILFGFEKF